MSSFGKPDQFLAIFWHLVLYCLKCQMVCMVSARFVIYLRVCNWQMKISKGEWRMPRDKVTFATPFNWIRIKDWFHRWSPNHCWVFGSPRSLQNLNLSDDKAQTREFKSIHHVNKTGQHNFTGFFNLTKQFAMTVSASCTYPLQHCPDCLN